MALSLRFRLHRRSTGSDAPPPDHLQGEMAASEPGNAFYYGYGNGTGDLASASHLLFRSDGTRLWHSNIGAADGSTVFKGDGSALTGVTAASVAWANVTSTPTTLAGYGITDAAPSSHVGAGGSAHAAATTSVAGFMAAADKTKLDGIAAGATVGATWGTNLGSIPASIDAIDGLTPAADRLAYYTGASTAALATITAAGRDLLDDANATAQRTTLGLGTAAVANVTTSATDTTAGRVLRVGDSATILSASPALRATVGGTGNAITLTTGASLPSLPTGLMLRWRAGSANTGATTINVDGLGAQPCVTVTGAVLPAGYIRTDVDTVAIWDGTNWQVQREAEAGSNSDGEWVRLANGWQECTRIIDLDGISLTTAYGALYRNASNLGPYAFPVAFANASSVYTVGITISGSDNSAIRTGVVCGRTRRAQTTKGLAWDGIALLCATSATGTAGEITRISLSATGRWY